MRNGEAEKRKNEEMDKLCLIKGETEKRCNGMTEKRREGKREERIKG